jgi:hypothetical protein
MQAEFKPGSLITGEEFVDIAFIFPLEVGFALFQFKQPLIEVFGERFFQLLVELQKGPGLPLWIT